MKKLVLVALISVFAVSFAIPLFAQVEQIGDNYTFAQYAFSTPHHIKLAGEYFNKYAEKMPLERLKKYTPLLF